MISHARGLHYTSDYFIARGNGCSVTPDEEEIVEERRAGSRQAIEYGRVHFPGESWQIGGEGPGQRISATVCEFGGALTQVQRQQGSTNQLAICNLFDPLAKYENVVASVIGSHPVCLAPTEVRGERGALQRRGGQRLGQQDGYSQQPGKGSGPQHRLPEPCC